MEPKVPNVYVGRVWVDVKFTAENLEEARTVLSKLADNIGWEQYQVDAEIYEVQSERIWTENGEYIK